jgi:enoyl-[acyl-carrier protein] reductase II
MHTPLCDVLGIEVPIICAPFGPWDQTELAAAVSAEGGLGSIGTALCTPAEVRERCARMRERTDRPFAVNQTSRPYDADVFDAILAQRPAAVSFHLAVPAELIARAHHVGITWIQQVMSREQAEAAVAAGADVLIAQGGEAGGHSGEIATMVLVPLVADVAAGVPVAAAGGIADGRGLAAALALGAQGVSMGTRFLASAEMRISDEWKRRIVEAGASDTVKVENSAAVLPPYTMPSEEVAPRSLRTPLVDQLRDHPEEAAAAAPTTLPAIVEAIKAGRGHEYLPFAGQTVGLIDMTLPAGEIVRRTVADAERILASLASTALPGPRP